MLEQNVWVFGIHDFIYPIPRCGKRKKIYQLVKHCNDKIYFLKQ